MAWPPFTCICPHPLYGLRPLGIHDSPRPTVTGQLNWLTGRSPPMRMPWLLLSRLVRLSWAPNAAGHVHWRQGSSIGLDGHLVPIFPLLFADDEVSRGCQPRSFIQPAAFPAVAATGQPGFLLEFGWLRSELDIWASRERPGFLFHLIDQLVPLGLAGNQFRRLRCATWPRKRDWMFCFSKIRIWKCNLHDVKKDILQLSCLWSHLHQDSYDSLRRVEEI